MEWILLAAGVLIGWLLALFWRQVIGWHRHWTPDWPCGFRQEQDDTTTPPRSVVRRREKPPDPEREKWEQILVNLERYDGTARGQCSITRRGNDN